jgi:23S rRNA (pseudouridine1915-N3)-methyltransferase
VKIKVVAVGKLKESYFRAAEAEYTKRLRPYCKLEITEVKSDKAALAAFPDRSYVVALDERGPSLTSREFAGDIMDAARMRAQTLVFAIGGADGHTEATRKRADRLISFGKQTIAHRLIRLVLLEQIYRGARILAGEPYHRD